MVKCGASMQGTEMLNSIRLQSGWSGASTTICWFDNIRMYKSLSVTVNGLDSKYIVELYDSRGNLVDRSSSGTLTIPALPLFSPPGYIKLLAKGNYSYSAPMSDVWGGDVYSLVKRSHASSLAKTGLGYGASSGSINDDSKPTGSTEIYSYWNGRKDLNWVDSANTSLDYAVSGTKHHESVYATSGSSNLSHWHGFKDATSSMPINQTDFLVQYVWLEAGKMPLEIFVQYYVQGAWRRAFWSASSTSQVVVDSAYNPSANNKYYCGPLPQVTGQWVQLAVKASALGVTGSYSVTGIIYGLYGGTAKWDFSSKASNGGVTVNGLQSGMKVKIILDNGTKFTTTAGGTSLNIDLSAQKLRAFPLAMTLEVLDGSNNLLYRSARVPEVYSGDTFTYSSPDFNVNTIKEGIRNRQVGALTYQDASKTVKVENHNKYDADGRAITSKSRLGSTWLYSSAGYDQYGNNLWKSDPTGRRTSQEYSYANKYTYPISSSAGDRTDTFDLDTSWTYQETPSDRAWLSGGYSSDRSYSGSKSQKFYFTGALSTNDNGMALEKKEFKTNRVDKISTRLYLQTYTHSEQSGEYMDSGIRMRLYDAAGSNYVTYTYWLACWSYTSENRSAPDAYTKVVFGQPATGSWLNIVLYPNIDFTIDWSSCDKVAFELYTNVYKAYGDTLLLYFDDFNYNDLTKEKTTYTYDINNGRAIASTDPSGHTKSQWFDAIGRVKQTNNSDGTYSSVIYDDGNNKATSSDELSQKTVSYFDKIGRNIKVERWGVGASAYSTVTSTYNWQDKPATVTNELNRVVKYTYDALGRITRTTNPDNSYTTTAFDDKNKRTTLADELGHKTVYVMDDLGRLNQTREYYTSTLFYTTQMAYDATGNLLTVKNDNNVTRMAYDSLGRKTSITYPDAKSESYTYDEAGRVLTATARFGVVTTNAYDNAGNNIRVIGSSDTIRTKYNVEGQVSERINALGNVSYYYNNRELVWRMVQKVNATQYSFTYTYNAVGNPTSVQYPDSRSITYLYDRYNRVVDVKIGNTLLLNQTYNKDDSVALKKYCNSNSSLAYTYNVRGFVSKILGRDSGNNIILNLNYNYTLDGNVAYINDTFGSAGVEQYWYDQLGRLTKAVSPLFNTIMYGYYPNGDRKWKNEGTNLTYTYGTYSKLSSNGTYSYVYNANGDLFWKNNSANAVQLKNTFNSFGQLTRVDKYVSGAFNSNLGQYYYDANGARAKVTEGGASTTYIYAGHDPMYQVGADGKGYKYIYVGGSLQLRVYDAAEKYAYLSDALGSTRKVLSNGQIGTVMFAAATYKPFGIAVSVTYTNPLEKMSYAGEMKDPTGLFYLFARYYEPELGRFISLDPELGSLSNPQTLNRYVYCANSPLIHTDPTGRWLNILIGAVIGAVVNTAIAIASGERDLGAILGEAAIGAATGALAGATFGVSVAGANLVTQGVKTLGNFGIKAMGALMAGSSSSAMGDVLHGKPIDPMRALISGVVSMATFGFGQKAGSLVSSSSVLKTELTKKFPSSKWDGYLFDCRKLGPLRHPEGNFIKEGFSTDLTPLNIWSGFAKSFTNKLIQEDYKGGW
jgi:RHS repeat-associated protein